MKLLFTGASGFIGNITTSYLKDKYEVFSMGLTPHDDYQIDIKNEIKELIESFDVVLHAAGKAHSIPRNEEEILDFYKVNLQGTKNLCKAFESNPPKAFVFVSTVAVYGMESGENIDEGYPLIGDTPYAQSKIEAEKFLKEWCNTHNVKLAIIRPSLIAGKNPPGNLGAMINGIKTGKYLRIGKGHTRKSVLMAEDIARLLPKLIEKGGTYNVCDNTHPSFYELEQLISKQLGKGSPLAIPLWIANLFAKVGDLLGEKAPINSAKLSKITQPLTFSNEKAKRELGWEPLSVLENFKIQ